MSPLETEIGNFPSFKIDDCMLAASHISLIGMDALIIELVTMGTLVTRAHLVAGNPDEEEKKRLNNVNPFPRPWQQAAPGNAAAAVSFFSPVSTQCLAP